MTHTAESFIRHFKARYESDIETRRDVHKHAKITQGTETKLKAARLLWLSWYRRNTDAMITAYSTHVFHQMKDLEELE